MAETEKRYFIVNPKGTVHEVTREHAQTRLREVGWRMATREEIKAFFVAGEHQAHDKPAGAPHVPEPEEVPDVDAIVAEILAEVDAEKKPKKASKKKPKKAEVEDEPDVEGAEAKEEE